MTHLNEVQTVTLADTQPLKLRTDAPQIKPLPSMHLPASSTYHVVDGLLTLAELYTHGGAQVRHHAIERTWDIRTSAQTATRVQVLPTATAITPYTKTADGWKPVETLCLPALPLHEQYRLFHARGQYAR